MNVIGIVGWKNSGKTTLAAALIRELSGRGLTVSSIKHAHHMVDVDQPGTDSYKHREAGAREVILAGGQRIAIMHELRGAGEPSLEDLLARLSPCDWVVVEGYKPTRTRRLKYTGRNRANRPFTGKTPTSSPLPATMPPIFPGLCSISMTSPALPILLLIMYSHQRESHEAASQ